MDTVKLLITVKTYPIPSEKYDELVCTAGVTEAGDFVRLYPINFRDLPYRSQYTKYQWIEVSAKQHSGRDTRKESLRPDASTLRILGEPLSTVKNWSARAEYVLKKQAASMEDLADRQASDRTSLGIFRPKAIFDLEISPDAPEWKPSFLSALKQAKIWDNATSREPPRKVPFKFHYRFSCNDARCKGKHRMMIEDWEVGALFWRLVDKGATQQEAAEKVRAKFLDEICSPKNDTHFYVGTILAHPKNWVVIGLFYPQKAGQADIGRGPSANRSNLRLFDDDWLCRKPSPTKES